MITSACATALAGLSSTKQSSSGSVDLHGAHFRGGNKYAGTYPAKMNTVVLIFANGAQIRARVCAPVHVYARGIEYAVTPVGRSNHWATKPRQVLRANFCPSPNCQFCFTTRWPECLSLQTHRDQRNSLDLTITVQIKIRCCRDHSI